MAVKRKVSSAAGAAKRQKQCAGIKEALLKADTFPLKVRQMVSSNLIDCLGVAKEDRHQVQEEVIDMVGQILKSQEQAFQKSIGEAEAKLGSATTEKESREQTKEAHAASVAARAEAQTNQKTALSASVEAVANANRALNTALAEQCEGDKDLNEAASKKEKLETALRESYTPLKEGSIEAGAHKKAVAALVELGKELHLDNSMITSLPSALAKADSERGTFDKMVLDTLGDELTKRIKQLEDDLANGEGAKADRAAKVDAAKNEKASAEASVASNREKLDQCNFDLNDAKASHRTATIALTQFGGDMKELQKACAAAQKDFASFREAALASYEELLKFSNVQPVEAVAEAEQPE